VDATDPIALTRCLEARQRAIPKQLAFKLGETPEEMYASGGGRLDGVGAMIG
jgi:hypothetical protein